MALTAASTAPKAAEGKEASVDTVVIGLLGESAVQIGETISALVPTLQAYDGRVIILYQPTATIVNVPKELADATESAKENNIKVSPYNATKKAFLKYLEQQNKTATLTFVASNDPMPGFYDIKDPDSLARSVMDPKYRERVAVRSRFNMGFFMDGAEHTIQHVDTYNKPV